MYSSDKTGIIKWGFKCCSRVEESEKRSQVKTRLRFNSASGQWPQLWIFIFLRKEQRKKHLKVCFTDSFQLQSEIAASLRIKRFWDSNLKARLDGNNVRNCVRKAWKTKGKVAYPKWTEKVPWRIYKGIAENDKRGGEIKVRNNWQGAAVKRVLSRSWKQTQKTRRILLSNWVNCRRQKRENSEIRKANKNLINADGWLESLDKIFEGTGEATWRRF